MTTATNGLAWNSVLRIWWAFLWRSLVFGFFGGIVAGVIGGVVLGVLGKGNLAGVVGGVLGVVVGIPISLYAMRVALTKPYQHFSIRFESPGNAG